MTTPASRPDAEDLDGMTAPELIAHRASTSPDEVFLRDTAGAEMTYADLHLTALAWARALDRDGVSVGTERV